MPRVAVAGCGHWGRNIVRNLSQLGALVAVHDVDPVARLAAAEETGVPTPSLDEILADASIDALAVAAPAAEHASIARRALLAGKDVFVEKPLALEVRAAEELCDIAEREGRVLMVGHLLRYHPTFHALQALVATGRLGRLQYAYSNRLNLGRFRREEDILWSFAPHDISMLLALIGEEPVTVEAVGSAYLHDDVADVTTTHLTFASGPRAHVFVSWLHPFKEQKLVVVGSDGMAVFDDGLDWDAKLQVWDHRVEWRDGRPNPVRAEPESIRVDPSEPLRVELSHFLTCVQERATPLTDGREGVRVLRVLAAAAASARRSAGEAHATRSDDVQVHESAYVDQPSEIGEGTRIWHFSHVLESTTIGRHCSIGQNVVVGPRVTIGDGCKIQNNVSIYEGVTLEDGVFCGPSCVFTNVVNPRAEISRRDEFRPTVVRRGATIGANATIVCGHEIGAYSFIAAGAVVTTDVPAHALMAGVPARRIGWMSHSGERLSEDLTCPASGRRYVERDGELEEVR